MEAIVDATTDPEARKWLKTSDSSGIRKIAGIERSPEPLSVLWDACDAYPKMAKTVKAMVHFAVWGL